MFLRVWLKCILVKIICLSFKGRLATTYLLEIDFVESLIYALFLFLLSNCFFTHFIKRLFLVFLNSVGHTPHSVDVLFT